MAGSLGARSVRDRRRCAKISQVHMPVHADRAGLLLAGAVVARDRAVVNAPPAW
jgi:hypothetical protein